MSLELVILGLLDERPLTGYDLKTRGLSGAVGTLWTADQAQIYRTLERLRTDGLVSVTRRRQSSRPDRRVFSLTPAGRDSLLARLSSTAPLPPVRDPFLVQLHFSAALSDQALANLLTARRAEYESRLERVREVSAELAEADDVSDRDAVLRQTALDGIAGQYRFTIEWLKDCERAVRDGALPRPEDGGGKQHLYGA